MDLSKEKIEVLESLIIECGDLEKGDFYKHSMVHAYYTLDVTFDFLRSFDYGSEEYQALEPFIGMRLSIDGTQDYENGWERGYNPIEVLESKEVVIPARIEKSWQTIDTVKVTQC